MKHAKIYGATLAIVGLAGLALIFLMEYFPDVFGGLSEIPEFKFGARGIIPTIFIIIFVLGAVLSAVRGKKPVEIPKPPK